MASSNDIGTVPFWRGLEEGKPYAGYKPSCGSGKIANALGPDELSTDQMVRIAHEQVEEVHGLPEIPAPYAAVYHSWDQDPYGGGWHAWKAGFRLGEIMCRMRKPVPEHDIFIVGEAYSFGHGWVEGALATAESALEEFFGLPQPEWLKLGNSTLLPNPCPGCGPLDGEHGAAPDRDGRAVRCGWPSQSESRKHRGSRYRECSTYARRLVSDWRDQSGPTSQPRLRLDGGDAGVAERVKEHVEQAT